MLTINSKMFIAAAYDVVQKILTLTFTNGTKYQYKDVEQETANAFENAESCGTFFAHNIRGKYAFAKV